LTDFGFLEFYCTKPSPNKIQPYFIEFYEIQSLDPIFYYDLILKRSYPRGSQALNSQCPCPEDLADLSDISRQVHSKLLSSSAGEAMAAPRRRLLLLALLAAVLSFSLASAFKSDELVLNDDDEFEGVGARPASPSPSAAPAVSSRRRSADASSAGAGESNVVQFTLEHDLGDGKGFVSAGSFSARLKSTVHGTQV
jgi:hypothetical protein